MSRFYGAYTKAKPETLRGRTDLLTGDQFARQVGTTPHELLRMHQQGYFVAAVNGKPGRGHQRLYAPEQLVEYKRTVGGWGHGRPKASTQDAAASAGGNRSLDKPLVAFSKEDAQTGFKALQEGRSLTDLVLKDGLHPDVAMSVAQTWAKMNGFVFVTGDVLDAISALPLDGPLPVRSASDLVEVLRLAAEGHQCSVCENHSSVACKRCIADAVTQARLKEREKVEAERPLPSDAAAPPDHPRPREEARGPVLLENDQP